jgi:hypothetical protein
MGCFSRQVAARPGLDILPDPDATVLTKLLLRWLFGEADGSQRGRPADCRLPNQTEVEAECRLIHTIAIPRAGSARYHCVSLRKVEN